MQKHTRTSFATPETKPNTTSFPWMGFGLALFLALLAGSNASANEPWLPQSYFGGITSDLQGNLVVDRETQASTTYLEKLSITGSQLSSVYGFPTARLATDPASGLIFALESNGRLLLVTPDASSGAEFLDLTTQNYEPGNPLDVSNGNRATASIDPRSAVYEDIALLRRGTQIDVVVSGAYMGLSFVSRIRIVNSTVQSAKVLVATSVFANSRICDWCPPDNGATGVAIDSVGTVLVTMAAVHPQDPPGSLPKRYPIKFSVDFPETNQGYPSFPLGPGQSIYTQGMTTDANGNFYIATNASYLCALQPASLLIISNNFQSFSCTDVSNGFENPQPVDVTVGPDGIATVIVNDFISQVSWYQEVSGLILTQKHVSVASDGTVWGINSGDEIYHYSGSGWNWIQGTLAQIAVGSRSSVWGLNGQGEIYRWDSDAESWSWISGTLAQISVGQNGAVWGINSGGQIYRFNGSGWDWIPGTLSQLSVGADGAVWGINSQQQIYRFNGSGWQWIPGALVQICVGSSESVWGLNASGNIYRWNDGAQSWDWVPGTLTQIAVGGDGDVWGINSGQQIYHYVNSGWNWVPGALIEIEVGSAENVWGLNAQGSIYRYDPRSSSVWDWIPGSL